VNHTDSMIDLKKEIYENCIKMLANITYFK